MLYSAPTVDPAARRDSEAVVLAVTRAAGSAFAPSAGLLADFTAGRAGWRRFERRYIDEMRALYRADPQLWIDLVEQAALEVRRRRPGVRRVRPGAPGGRRGSRPLSPAGAEGPPGSGGHRTGAAGRPPTDDLQRTLLEARRTAVLAAEGRPLTCPVCQRPADTSRALRGRDGYGYCSEACLEFDVARWKAQLWSAGSGRRP